MLNVGKIEEGIVLDHIEAGKAMLIYHYLHLDKEDYQVAIIKNARSNELGRKDILKVECDPDVLNLDAVAFIDPEITVNVIKGGEIVEKKRMTPPKEPWSRNSPTSFSWRMPSGRSTAAATARRNTRKASGKNGSADEGGLTAFPGDS